MTTIPLPLRVLVPLTDGEAYWHACTGTPIVERWAPVIYDECAPMNTVYLLSRDYVEGRDGQGFYYMGTEPRESKAWFGRKRVKAEDDEKPEEP